MGLRLEEYEHRQVTYQRDGAQTTGRCVTSVRLEGADHLVIAADDGGLTSVLVDQHATVTVLPR